MPREAPVTIATLLLFWIMFGLLSFARGRPASMAGKWCFSGTE
jgi:hypothetical protein